MFSRPAADLGHNFIKKYRSQIFHNFVKRSRIFIRIISISQNFIDFEESDDEVAIYRIILVKHVESLQ